MEIEKRTPENIAIILIDYVTSFANMVRSQTTAENVTGAVAMAKLARGFNIPLIVTTGPPNDPRGPLYPELQAVLGDHPVVHRAGEFNSFDVAEFDRAVTATGRRHLVFAGLTTEGCVLQTMLGALRRDYAASLVVDATAALSQISHDCAVSRLMQHSVTPLTWLSLAAELQQSYANQATLSTFLDVQGLLVPFTMNRATISARTKWS